MIANDENGSNYLDDSIHKTLLGHVQTNSESFHEFKFNLISSIITATSNFSVQYNFQAISVALLIMSETVCTSTEKDCGDGQQAEWVTSTSTAAVFAGAICGQLVMGYVADIIGRNKAMLLTLSTGSIGALLSAIISFGSPETIYSLIIICRFILGIGLGGVYPISAAKAAEDGSSKSGKTDVIGAAWSFFWQCPGAMTPWLLAYLFTYSALSAEMTWRLLLGLGVLPGLVVLIASQYDQTNLNVIPIRRENSIPISKYLQQWDIRKKLLLTGGSWFLYDISYYGVNLFGGEILSAISPSDDDNISSHSSIRRKASLQLIAQSTSIPANILTILLYRWVGMKHLHNWGFVLIGLALVLMAIFFDDLKKNNPDGLFALYCFLLFTLSGGPNVTTFILPSQLFAKEVRTTCNGISAASGKLGAIVGAYIFGSVADATSYVVVMILCAVTAFVAAIMSYAWFPKELVPTETVEEEENLT